MNIKLSKSDWQRIGVKMGWMKKAQDKPPVEPSNSLDNLDEIRAERISNMKQLKQIASKLDPRVVPYLTNMAAANNWILSVSPKMQTPEVKSLVDRSIRLDMIFTKSLPEGERKSTLESFKRAINRAKEGAAELKAGMDPEARKNVELSEARTIQFLKSFLLGLSGFSATMAGGALGAAGALPGVTGGLIGGTVGVATGNIAGDVAGGIAQGVKNKAEGRPFLGEKVDLSGDTGSMAAQYGREKGGDQLKQIEENRKNRLKQKNLEDITMDSLKENNQ